MVNHPHSIPPKGPGSIPPEGASPPSAPGAFNVGQPHQFLGMTFTAKEWNELMNVMLQNLSTYMNHVMQKMREKMKKDWRREEGKD